MFFDLRFFASIYIFLTFFSCSAQPTAWQISIEKLPEKISFEDQISLNLLSNQEIDSMFWMDDNGNKMLIVEKNLSLPTTSLGKKKLRLQVFSKKEKKILSVNYEVFSNIIPEQWTYQIKNNYTHLSENYTQGLEFFEDFLYESTGLYDQSKVLVYAFPKLNQPILQENLSAQFFGEGLTIIKNSIYQLTWKNQEGLIYERENLKKKDKFSYLGEGWGLAHNEKNQLILSNGSEKLQFINPENFVKKNEIFVYSNNEKITLLNELEYVDGQIWANRYYEDKIYVIEEKTGRVLAFLDFSDLRKQLKNPEKAEVLNGIAYYPKKNRFLITGKLWSDFFEVEILKPN